ncbi:WhiB family transcriptional regulator [Streptomyces sp. NPDC087437]|uniref:WhiB family transcriptional regulator n=1 Tax=Streptomyces sp. NPDC087437 TaxID=3365789 RepID=UPI00380EE0FC
MGGYTGQIPDTAARQLDWQARAHCRAVDPEIFFTAAEEREARQLCAACPVLGNCHTWVMQAERGQALSLREGIVAGLTPEQRLALDPAAPKHLPAPIKDKPKSSKAKPQKHGTRACYKAGCRRPECVAANREYTQSLRQRKAQGEPVVSQPPPAPCPSVAAYRRHLKKGEPVDEGCRAAYAKDRATRNTTQRNRQVYALWSKGLPDAEIAARLNVGTRAVRNARERLGLIANVAAI